jgi:pimeloyl-ACP methyl ester carboxylesterase
MKEVAQFAEGFLKAVLAPQTFGSNPDIVNEIRRTVLSNPQLGICGALLAMAGRTDTTDSLSKINIPTLIFVGEHDAVTPPNAARNMDEESQTPNFMSSPTRHT